MAVTKGLTLELQHRTAHERRLVVIELDLYLQLTSGWVERKDHTTPSVGFTVVRYGGSGTVRQRLKLNGQAVGGNLQK